MLTSRTFASDSDSMQTLAHAIEQAAEFPNLKSQVEAAQMQYERAVRRSQAVQKLESILDEIRARTTSAPVPVLCKKLQVKPEQDPAAVLSEHKTNQKGKRSTKGVEIGPLMDSVMETNTQLSGSGSSTDAKHDESGSAAAVHPSPPSVTLIQEGEELVSGTRKEVLDSAASTSVDLEPENICLALSTVDLIYWKEEMTLLESALSEAREANVSISKVRYIEKLSYL